MATIRKIRGKWQSIIRKKNYPHLAKTILENFNNEVQNFKQVCPKEMLDKLTNPLLLKTKVSKAV